MGSSPSHPQQGYRPQRENAAVPSSPLDDTRLQGHCNQEERRAQQRIKSHQSSIPTHQVPQNDERPAMASSTAEGIILTPEMCLQRSRERYLRSLEAHRVFIRELRNGSTSGTDAADSFPIGDHNLAVSGSAGAYGSVDLHDENSFELMQRALELQLEHSVTSPTAAVAPSMPKTPCAPGIPHEPKKHSPAPFMTSDAQKDSATESSPSSSPKASQAAAPAAASSRSATFQPLGISNYHQQLETLRQESSEKVQQETSS